MSNENKLIPELRFPEFENEGEWDKPKLSSVSDVIMGSSPSSLSYNENKIGLPLLQGNADIKNRLSTPRIYTTEITKECEIGDILLSVRAPVGTVAKSLHNACIGRGISALSAKKPNSQEYIYQWLFSYESSWAKISQGGTFDAVNSDDIKNLLVPIPKPKEQQKIASCLSSLDEVIAAHSQKLDLLKDHKKGLMQNLFPQEGEKVPKYRFKEFEKDGEWVEKIFDDILDITRLAGYEYSEYWKEDENKEIIALRGYNIGKGTLLLHNLGYISNELSLQLIRSKLYKGDIVYPCVGTIGNAVVIEENNKYHIQQNIAKLTPKKDVSPYFISQFLMGNLGMREVNKFNATSSQPNVLVGSLRNFKIFIPKIAEQQKIASCLSSLDALITAQTERIEQLKQHKKGLMQGLFPKINE